MDIYCLDTNALVEPWNKYYSIAKAPDYWSIIDRLAHEGTVFCPEEVQREIERVDDDLKKWVRARPYMFRSIDREVQLKIREILMRFPRLVDTIKDRSMADPWVIAHAMAEGAVVVTKEGTAPRKIKIPDVCDAFSVRWIDDYKFVSELGIQFTVTSS